MFKINSLEKFFYYFFLFFFALLTNNHYGSIGVNPIDNFMIFSSANLILNGKLPFEDFWITYGLLPNLIQAIFFKFSEVNWSSYVFHASIFNAIITVSLFSTFLIYGLEIKKSFFYSLIFAILFYPTVGTPFVDHHSVFFSLLAVFSFLVAIKNNSFFFWSLIPILLISGFLSKQTPTAYIGLVLFFFSIFAFFKNKNFKILYSYLASGFASIGIILILLYHFKIDLDNFILQFIKFPLDVGSGRIEAGSFLAPFTFSRYFIKFKYINILNLIILFSLLNNVSKKKNLNDSKNQIASILIIFCSFALILHQQLTLNSKYIFFLIPVLAGFAHISWQESSFKKKKFLSYFIIILSTLSSFYYFYNYIHNRSFLIVNNMFKKEKVYQTNILDNSKKKFNWITHYNDNPKEEIAVLNDTILKIKNFKNENNYMIVTDYQFIFSSFKLKKSIIINQLYASGITYPSKENKYFLNYKNFFLNKIKENNIDTIFFILPNWFDEEKYSLDGIINLNCVKKINYKNFIKIDNIQKCFL